MAESLTFRDRQATNENKDMELFVRTNSDPHLIQNALHAKTFVVRDA